MIYIPSVSHDPAFNLAAEEYVLSRFAAGDFLMLWTNDPCVVIGKFQDPYEEVSLDACLAAGVPVFRRNSGGGAVYHDRGNLNYTVLTDRGADFPDYGRFLSPVIRMLEGYGVTAEIRDTSALFVGGAKISGSAQSNLRLPTPDGPRDRVLHHGTLLFDADLAALRRLTGHAREHIRSKTVKSNPAPVTNLAPLLRAGGGPADLEALEAQLREVFSAAEERPFTEEELRAIGALAEEKYRSWEWNYGKSPAFTVSAEGLTLTAKNGVVLTAETGFCDPARLIGRRLVPEEIRGISGEVYDLLFR